MATLTLCDICSGTIPDKEIVVLSICISPTSCEEECFVDCHPKCAKRFGAVKHAHGWTLTAEAFLKAVKIG